MTIMIRPEYREYITKELGFSDIRLENAYKKALTKSQSTDCTVIEIVTRDILQGNDEYLNEPKTCANCLNDTASSDEEPCISCTRNPQTQIEDKWELYTPPT